MNSENINNMKLKYYDCTFSILYWHGFIKNTEGNVKRKISADPEVVR